MYEILKVLNHNTILVLKENEEIIVMSKGIGFGKKQGENVNFRADFRFFGDFT